mmetsp:Transcript_62362/g.174233  ORF Transcript_62362/g.174233 Transcript_62362/m.174233 type:complete len:1082 (+) Transcript_62362:2016-5261(+)
MRLQHCVQVLQLLGVGRMRRPRVKRGHVDLWRHHALADVAGGVPDPSDATAHAGGEVVANVAEDDDAAPRHVLAAMVPGAFHHGPSPRVAHGEALRGDTADEADAGGRAVERRVADDDVLLRLETCGQRRLGRVHDDGASAEALAEVVLRVSLQLQEDAAQREGPEGLAGGALELGVARARRQAVAPALVELVGQQGAQGAVDVRELVAVAVRGVAEAEGRLERLQQVAVLHRLRDHEVVLAIQLPALDLPDLPRVRQQVRRHQHGAELQRRVAERRVHAQCLRAADGVVYGPEAHLREEHAHLLRDQHQVVHDVLRHTFELLAEDGVLRGDAHRAGVEVALPHHDAAHGDEGGCGEAEALGPEQRSDHHVAARAQLAVGLQGHAPTEAVQHQGLVRLREADFPRGAGVLDARPLRRAGAAVAPADEDVVGLALRHAGGDDADADLAHELHADGSLGVRVLEVEDELREVLDGVDVMVRRRRDEADALGGAARRGDVAGDLGARQLAALAGLGALRHLDLQLLRVGEVLHRHAEAARGDLLNGGLHGVAFGRGLVADGVLTALARVGEAADAVHRLRERRVGLHGDGAVGHGPGAEALHDLARGLHGLEGDRGAAVLARRLEVQLTAEGRGLHERVVQRGEGRVGRTGIRTCRLLQLRDHQRVVDVLLRQLALAPMVLALIEEALPDATARGIATLVHCEDAEAELLEAVAAELAGDAAEAHVHDLAAEADGVGDLRPLVAPQRRDAHLRHDLQQPLAHGLLVALEHLDIRLADLVRQLALLPELQQGLICHVGADGVGAKGEQKRVVRDLIRVSAVDNERDLRAKLLRDEGVVHRAADEQRRELHPVVADRVVGEHDDLATLRHSVDGLAAEAGEVALQAGRALLSRERRLQGPDPPLLEDAANLGQRLELVREEAGVLQPQAVAVLGRRPRKNVLLGANPARDGHHDGLADGVDRRVRDLREELVEVVEDRAGLAGEARQGRVVAHAAQRLLPIAAHRHQQQVEGLACVAKGPQGRAPARGVEAGNRRVLRQGLHELRHADALLGHPLAPRLRHGQLLLHLSVAHEAALSEVGPQHLAG